MDLTQLVSVLVVISSLTMDGVESQKGTYEVEFLKYQNLKGKLKDNSSCGETCQYEFYINFRNGNETLWECLYTSLPGATVDFTQTFRTKRSGGGKWSYTHQPLKQNLTQWQGLWMNVVVRHGGSLITNPLVDNFTGFVSITRDKANKWVTQRFNRSDDTNIFLKFQVRVNCSDANNTCLPEPPPPPTTTSTGPSTNSTTQPPIISNNELTVMIACLCILPIVIIVIIICVVYRRKIRRLHHQIRRKPLPPKPQRQSAGQDDDVYYSEIPAPNKRRVNGQSVNEDNPADHIYSEVVKGKPGEDGVYFELEDRGGAAHDLDRPDVVVDT